MRIAIVALLISLWAVTTITLAKPIGDESPDGHVAMKVQRDVAGWIWDHKPTGTKERPHKCPHNPCITACEIWAVLLSFGISCVSCQSVHSHCFYKD
ncbi:hypothetical protein PgNI_10369 [Pyricularia grisea]|uniref:Uncharacterized protein n=1 Tax=Pyricularia grisea TaxID=148305 RepID=A0A6P8AY91_PYRGI|nr:hypothetical protein PgNI_10369 [Pyricularia grisea]TLD07251.1 hypothetical protein PgNI_10369 [Pyricularia grisea]